MSLRCFIVEVSFFNQLIQFCSFFISKERKPRESRGKRYTVRLGDQHLHVHTQILGVEVVLTLLGCRDFSLLFAHRSPLSVKLMGGQL